MTPHLTKNDLLAYQFELCSEREAKRIDRHLKKCKTCQRLAELLDDTFSQLDTIGETEPASEQLIADTLRAVRTYKKPRITFFPKIVLGTGALAAAALLLILLTRSPISSLTNLKLAKGSAKDYFDAEHSKAIPESVVREMRLAKVDVGEYDMEFATQREFDEYQLNLLDGEYAAGEAALKLAMSFEESSDSAEPLDVPVEADASAELARAELAPDAGVIGGGMARSEEAESKPPIVGMPDDVTTHPEGNTRIAVLAMAQPAQPAIRRRKTKKKPSVTKYNLFAGGRVGTDAPMMESIAPAAVPQPAAPARGVVPTTPPTERVMSLSEAETSDFITSLADSRGEWQLGPHRAVSIRREQLVNDGIVDKTIWQWQVSAINTGDIPTRLVFTRQFPSTNWTISVSEEATLVIQDSQTAEISLDVPAQSERSFIYRIGLPTSVQ